MKPNVVIPFSIQRMVCTSCGAEANASCNCGVSYVPAAVRAAEAVAANPGKSDRAIAADLGVSHQTVGRVRTGPIGPVDKRVGKDGKVRRLPVRSKLSTKDQVKAFHTEVVGFFVDFDSRVRAWAKEQELESAAKRSLMEAIYLASDGLAKLAQALDGR